MSDYVRNKQVLYPVTKELLADAFVDALSKSEKMNEEKRVDCVLINR